VENFKFGAILPHPPILISQIGGIRIKEAEKSQRALKQVASLLKDKEKDIDTIVLITPHGSVSQANVPIYTSPVFEGDFGYFGASKLRYQFKGDSEFAIFLVKEAENQNIPVSRCPETILDHGVLVPLHYYYEKGFQPMLLPIAVALWPLEKLFNFGKCIYQSAEKLNRKIAFIASADLSHRLTPDAPAGFHTDAKKFDEKLVKLVEKNDVQGILSFPEDLAENAGQDALWSIAVLLGVVSELNVKVNVLSYEGPFGVGYLVATFEAG
jgi:AmmeMemoRadiSam system protein B